MAGAKRRMLYFGALALLAGVVAIVVKPEPSGTALRAASDPATTEAPKVSAEAEAAVPATTTSAPPPAPPTFVTSTTSLRSRPNTTVTTPRPSAMQPTSPAPSPSPSARRTRSGQIVFQDASGPFGIMNPDGTGRRLLGFSGSNPSWAPDGLSFVFTGGSSLMRGYPEGGGPDTLYGRAYSPSVSPDGRIGANTQGCVFVGNGYDGRCIVLMDSVRRVVFSADGARVFFSASETDADGNATYGLYSADSHTGGDRRLIMTDAFDADIAPDGRILFMRHGGNSRYQTWIADPDGTHQRNLTNDREPQYWASWSPDGAKILFTSYFDTPNGSRFKMGVMNLDGVVERYFDGAGFGDW